MLAFKTPGHAGSAQALFHRPRIKPAPIEVTQDFFRKPFRRNTCDSIDKVHDSVLVHVITILRPHRRP